MITQQIIQQTRAFARQDGFFLSLVWIASFIGAMLAHKWPSLSLISFIFAISTPFVVSYTLKLFRDKALDGLISFRRAWFYAMETYFYATLILTVVQFVYFEWGDTVGFMTQINESVKIASEYYKQQGISAQEIKNMGEALTMMSSAAWASLFMIYELIFGCITSPIIALLMKRTKK